MNRDEHDKTFLHSKSEFLEREARYLMLDMVRCEMHNEGYNLSGNTAESDRVWLARILFERRRRCVPGHWDAVPEEVRQEYFELADITLEAIPRLMGRISARCIRISQAVNTIIKAEKLHEWHEEREKGRPSRI